MPAVLVAPTLLAAAAEPLTNSFKTALASSRCAQLRSLDSW